MWYRLHAPSMFNYTIMAHTPAENPDFVKFAECHGAIGYRVEKTADFMMSTSLGSCKHCTTVTVYIKHNIMYKYIYIYVT